jgi:hypothetical protein
MKVVQYNKDSDAVLVADDFNGASLDVSGMGPDSIAAQLTISGANSPTDATAQFEGSIDGSNWFALGSPVSITTNAVLSLAATPVYYKYYRVAYTITSDKAALVNQSLTYTAVDAGPAGEDITITLIDTTENDEPFLIEVTGTDIVVTLETDSGGSVITTGNALKTALNADADAAALILVTGTNASVLNALAETPLAGATSYFTVVEHALVYGQRI